MITKEVALITIIFWPLSSISFGFWMGSFSAGLWWLSALWVVSAVLDEAARKVGKMTCACEYIGESRKKADVATCGLHHWRERNARLRGIREALREVKVPIAEWEAIFRKLEPSLDYIYQHFQK